MSNNQNNHAETTSVSLRLQKFSICNKIINLSKNHATFRVVNCISQSNILCVCMCVCVCV